MSIQNRPYVLSIAGHDPTGGAGLLADIKTMEQLGCMGMGVCTSVTAQTEDEFISSNWVVLDQIKQQLLPLLDRYQPSVIKIGLIQSLDVLIELLQLIRSKGTETNQPKVILDPVFKASSGFQFHENVREQQLKAILEGIDLMTPNMDEAALLAGTIYHNKFLQEISHQCAILLKGGHAEDHADDVLYHNGETHLIEGTRIPGISKHGTGCVLSSAIASHIAQGHDLIKACELAKTYVRDRLIDDGSGLMIHQMEKVYD